MDRDAIRSFARRDRRTVAEAKERWWAGRDANATIRAARALWEHTRRVRPDWPTAEDRTEDLEHHVWLKALLDRAAHAFPRR